MNPRVETLREASYYRFEDGRTLWTATRLDLEVELLVDDPDLVLYADPINTMRQVGIALVDHTGTMRANTRRDRRSLDE